MIQYICPFCSKETYGDYVEYVDTTEHGARYHCLCPYCLTISLVQTFPFEVARNVFESLQEISMN